MAPTTLRSVSISSSSTTSSKTASDGIKKKFSCSHPSCGKSFSRSEHLHRHALNHKEGNNTCLRCSAHFRRRDLLDRHMSRHKEKDDEAGGEGLGVLATRKRLWRDADGKIVNARRPSYTPEMGNKRRMINKTTTERRDSKNSQILTALPPSPISMSRTGSTHSTIIVDTTRQQQIYDTRDDEELQHHHNHNHHRPSWYHTNGPALLSPITTSPSSAYSDHGSSSSLHSESQSPSAELDTLYEDTWPIGAPVLPEIVNHSNSSNSPLLGRESGYPANPGWGPQPSFQTFMGAIGEFEDVSSSASPVISASAPIKEIFGSSSSSGLGLGLYGWQNPWSVSGGSQMMLSRCREEKFDGLSSLSERGAGGLLGGGGVGDYRYPHSDLLRRGFGLGGC